MRIFKWILATVSALLLGGLAYAGIQTFGNSRRKLNRLDRKTQVLSAREQTLSLQGSTFDREAVALRVRLAQAQSKRALLLSRWTRGHEGQDLAVLVDRYNREAP